MTSFELVEPASLAEAIDALNAGDPSVRAGGGCTALMLMMKANVLKLSRLVSLRRIEPRYFAIGSFAGEIRIGAQATLSALEHAAHVRRELPLVVSTLNTLSNVRVRNVATLGGHLAHADPHMDLPPVLLALGAQVVVAGAVATRTLSIDELITGYLETSLAPDELIAEVHVPYQGTRRAAYMKVTTRAADDWPALGVTVAFDVAGDRMADVRVVVSAATDRPQRLMAVEHLLEGAAVDERVLREAGDAAVAAVEPIADVHGSAAYKKQLVRVYVGRAIRKAMQPRVNGGAG